ncbi:MAG: His/Gly/Thr/Pro-type tRNA ligase C-terminal domain-containing protein, partial [bacterium]
RFIAFLIEHYAGAFPTWLAPEQVVIIPIADRHTEYARKVHAQLFNAEVPTALGGIRVEVDEAREKMQKKIRNAQRRKVPYMLICGDNEMENELLSVRYRSGVEKRDVPVVALIERIRTEVKSRRDVGEVQMELQT